MWRPRSLVQRVVLSVALGSLSAGAIVAVITVLLTNHLASEQEDQHLRAAAGTLAYELQVKRYDPYFAVGEETHELSHTGIVVALFEQGRYLAGDKTLPFVAPGQCASSWQLRACAVTADRWVAIAGREPMRLRAQADATLAAAGIALVVTSLFSTGLALLLAFAATKPLEALTQRLRQLPVHAGAAAELGPPSGVHEVEAVRAALLEAFATLRRSLARSHSFSGDAAHQLRTPLATISAELDLAIEAIDALEGPEAKDDATREQCVRARQQASRLAALIDQLLILANPDDTIQVATAVSLQPLLRDALHMLPQAARERVTLRGENITLQGDPTLLLTAIVATLESALQHNTSQVHISTRAQQQHALVTIDYEAAGPTSDDITRAVIERVTVLHGGRAHFNTTNVELLLPTR
jgi:two-component system, OmpR family, sensor kinase